MKSQRPSTNDFHSHRHRDDRLGTLDTPHHRKTGMSSLLVIPKAWARFILAPVIWAPKSAVAGAWADMLVTLGRGRESS